MSGIFALVIRRTNWETIGQKYTLKRWGNSTSERVIDAMITTRCGKMLDKVYEQVIGD